MFSYIFVYIPTHECKAHVCVKVYTHSLCKYALLLKAIEVFDFSKYSKNQL